MSIQDALKLWDYTEPYLEKLERFDWEQMESCQELLTQLTDIIPLPPDDIFTNLGPDKLLYEQSDVANNLSEFYLSHDSSELDNLPYRCISNLVKFFAQKQEKSTPVFQESRRIITSSALSASLTSSCGICETMIRVLLK